MKLDCDVLIAGAGISGPLLACALSGSGLRIVLCGRRPAPPQKNQEYDLRVSALTPATVEVLSQLGVWNSLESRAGRIECMHVWDESGGGNISFDSADTGQPALARVAENSAVARALAARLANLPDVEWVESSVTEIGVTIEAARARFENGSSRIARLIVGADGTQSTIRQLAGIASIQWPYSQSAIVAHVRTAKSHQNRALQVFRPEGTLAFLPLPEPDHSSIVWSAETQQAEALAALGDDDFRAQLQSAIGDRLGTIESVTARATFPLALRNAKNYIAERIALIGDAAHQLHPLAGQGLNLGVQDAMALANAIRAAHEAKRDIGSHRVLRSYERARRGPNWLMLSAVDAFARGFRVQSAPVVSLRSTALSAADRIVPLKKTLMRYASGL
jgi:2-octaprenylphenol hydroxylase